MDKVKEMAEEAEGGGNTKPPLKVRISAAKLWCFTLNNYTNVMLAELASLFQSYNCEWIIGKEVGDSGTPHLQGFIYFNCKGGVRPMEKVKNKSIHWEKCKGNKYENITYCKKDGDYIFGNKLMAQWIKEADSISEQKNYKVTLDFFYNYQLQIINIIETKPNYRDIYWFWEEDGNTGKTEFQKYIFTNYEKVCIVGGKSGDMKNCIVDYVNKTSFYPKIILINLPKSSSTYISYTGVEEIKDMMFYSGKYEGGMICGPRPHMFIFANREPPIDKMSEDKFQEIHINRELPHHKEIIDDQTDRSFVHCLASSAGGLV